MVFAQHRYHSKLEVEHSLSDPGLAPLNERGSYRRRIQSARELEQLKTVVPITDAETVADELRAARGRSRFARLPELSQGSGHPLRGTIGLVTPGCISRRASGIGTVIAGVAVAAQEACCPHQLERMYGFLSRVHVVALQAAEHGLTQGATPGGGATPEGLGWS